MKGLIQKIYGNWMVALDKRTWQDPSAEDLIIPLHIDDLWVIDHTGYILGKYQELDFEILTVEEGVTDCGNHIIYRDYAKVTKRPTQKEAMTPSEILMKHEDANEYHLHEVDRKWIIEAMEEYKLQSITLPSDEEIYKEAKRYESYHEKMTNYEAEASAGRYHGFYQGVKYIINKIKGDNK